jgi:glycosyl-4,4'-diaponeurosporenoate acyltransferase
LSRFAAETRRAELVHWCVLALTPFFVLWNPVGLFLAMVAYGVIANVPCIAIQRYNRSRIVRALAWRAARPVAQPHEGTT